MTVFPYTSYDAVGLAQLVRNKEISPIELVHAAMEQINQHNPELNAVVHTRYEATIHEAGQVSISDQPFAGVPILLKDISQAIGGEPLTSGSRLFRHYKAHSDSHFVAKLRKAGFIPLGHTNTPEFGLKNITEPQLNGPTRNPWNPLHSPGGSSGGSAAAVASGMVPIAGASDGGGSIRIPASFSGLFGLKPTRGRTPVGPGFGRQWQGASIDFALSKTVRDSAALLDVLQVLQNEAAFQVPLYPGKYLEDMYRNEDGTYRIAYTTDSPVGTEVSVEAKQAVLRLVNFLEAEGHFIEEKLSPVNGVQLMENYCIMNCGEMAAMALNIERSLGRAITSEDIEIEGWVLLEAGRKLSAAEYALSLADWDAAAAQMSTIWDRYDFYITPATAFPAPRVGELTPGPEQIQHLLTVSGLSKEKQQELIYDMFEPSLTYTPFTQLANLTGTPAMSVPVFLTETGLPLGVQIMSSKGREHDLFSLAHLLENSSLWVRTSAF
ncbi:amidase [Paenibacillus sp. FSL W8-0186]|uniref:Amidase n=1 Tax=Paenibacillus woosongensis TaxID=307580 RepID=A0ABQ4MLD4_9BACL|nr:amidase [Paenibacillus woosongensis]GIP56230.1 amidase [Paenibacillus woosongensis]